MKIETIRQRLEQTDLRFTAGGQPLPYGSMWLLFRDDNTRRGKVAEDVVADLVGGETNSEAEGCDDWSPEDVVVQTAAGPLRLSVKFAGALQPAGKPRTPQRCTFQLSEQMLRDVDHLWNPVAWKYELCEPRLPFDALVFAVHAHTDRATWNLRELEQWTFFVIPITDLRRWLAESGKNARSISYQFVVDTGVKPLSYSELRDAVRR